MEINLKEELEKMKEANMKTIYWAEKMLHKVKGKKHKKELIEIIESCKNELLELKRTKLVKEVIRI